MKHFALISLALLATSCATQPPETPEKIAEKQAVIADMENRPEARIAFVQNLESFAVKRENKEDVLYITDGFGRWYRGPLTCFGVGDPQSAMSIGTISHDSSIDKFTRFILLSPGSREKNECTINALKELKPQETVLFDLESQKRVDSRAAAKNKANEKK